jgi:hypothetical protein
LVVIFVLVRFHLFVFLIFYIFGKFILISSYLSSYSEVVLGIGEGIPFAPHFLMVGKGVCLSKVTVLRCVQGLAVRLYVRMR